MGEILPSITAAAESAGCLSRRRKYEDGMDGMVIFYFLGGWESGIPRCMGSGVIDWYIFWDTFLFFCRTHTQRFALARLMERELISGKTTRHFIQGFGSLSFYVDGDI